ncbi:hypothetical protein SADUNF_Sadunf17G0005600 [Salix dunnii]|uniref:Cysteine protease n=1 Tax=Salix dunnii TaxID=1413687 RepID=A0A835J211_9ROSI|nr:hypothetical protein SADUNF_Sadunf17G0005600 [Salix dunnii]
MASRSMLQDNSSGAAATTNALAAFYHDCASRILITYRKGFDAIEDSKLTSDVSWGCMLRSSQMLVAQLCCCISHINTRFSDSSIISVNFPALGPWRSLRKPLDKHLDREYVEILHLFGDSESSTFSIHNLLRDGKAYGLQLDHGLFVWLIYKQVHSKREETNLEYQSVSMAVYVISDSEDGERGGAPVICIKDAARRCSEFSKGQED